MPRSLISSDQSCRLVEIDGIGAIDALQERAGEGGDNLVIEIVDRKANILDAVSNLAVHALEALFAHLRQDALEILLGSTLAVCGRRLR